MQVKNDTRYLDAAALLTVATEDTLRKIREAAPYVVLGSGGYYDMTLGQFGALLQGAEPLDVFARGSYEDLTVFEYYTIAGLADFIKQYSEQLVKLTPQPDNGDVKPSTLPMSATEALLVFAREYFGLQSFAAAEKTTLADLLIAKKDAYNKIMVQRAQIAAMKRKGIKK